MRMDTTSRIALVLWSAVPGLIIGLLIGGGVWVVVQLVGQLVPGAGSLVQRWQAALGAVCFGVIPLVAVVAGALEGWLKQR